ncbi:Serine/threonine-protein kinase BtrW [Variovorax sp. PBS-H4]|uniref:ATP-binding protein n=1 Tax=Variovorax sp. PBS-H4 TaxID=434008 RepID=UPI001318D87F|nr:ATP-binding protein [Variovorax sp. PBS-H4]VTU23552.1 Serine/threonine-protein kinase BtrW [Variovorax sp. PBS-H4]
MSRSDREPLASLIVGSELRELPRVSAWVQDWAQRQRLPSRVAQQLDLCSTEALTNIMTHGSGDEAAHCSISLRLGWRGEDVALEVEDEGRPFDPLQAPDPARAGSLEDAQVGGWGIPIVRHFSDGMHYRREDGRNRLTLLFRPTAPP